MIYKIDDQYYVNLNYIVSVHQLCPSTDWKVLTVKSEFFISEEEAKKLLAALEEQKNER